MLHQKLALSSYKILTTETIHLPLSFTGSVTPLLAVVVALLLVVVFVEVVVGGGVVVRT